jgi:hypothetical protein
VIVSDRKSNIYHKFELFLEKLKYVKEGEKYVQGIILKS